MPFCELVYAGVLCIDAVSGGPNRIVESDVQLEVWGVHPTAGARLRADGWSAVVVDSTDALMRVNPKTLSQACDGDVCVRYHLFCKPEVRLKHECAFSIERPGRDQPLEVSVTAYGSERWQAAVRSLSYITPDGKRIPLEAMSTRSTRETPYCARIRREAPQFEPDCDFLNR